MRCYRCLNRVHLFATRCENCTTTFGIIELWFVNLLGNLMALGLLGLLIFAILST